MIELIERNMFQNHNNIQINKLLQNDNNLLIFASVNPNVQIFDNTVQNMLGKIKKKLTNNLQDVVFIIYQGSKYFAFGIDQYQKLMLSISDEEQFIQNYLLSKEEGWLLKMLSARVA